MGFMAGIEEFDAMITRAAHAMVIELLRPAGCRHDHRIGMASWPKPALPL